MKIAGIILAAGESKRMGRPKALLELSGGRTLLTEQVALLTGAGCEPVVVVVGSGRDVITRAHPHLDVSWCINEEWELGQFSSLKAGVAHILHNDTNGAIVLPVDAAGIEPSTVAALIGAAGSEPAPYAVVPTFGGKGGHPIYISLEFCLKIVKTEVSDGGARLDTMVRESTGTRKMPVEDANVIRNINTPDEWRRVPGDN